MAQILVVDDSTIIQRTLSLIIRKMGHQTVIAENGLRAIDMIAGNEIALAVVDMNMPGMNGLDLVEHIRSHETDSHLPIVFLTGSGHASDQESAMELGVDGFLNKPVSSHELREVINQLL